MGHALPKTNLQQMRHFTCEPGTEVLGESISSFLNNFKSEETRQYMEKYGLYDIDDEKWYLCQHYMDVINDIIARTNTMENLVAVGMQIAKQLVFPPGPEPTYEEFLMAWDDLYHLHFRGGDVGHVQSEKIGNKKYRVVNSTIQPDDMVYGVAYGFGQRLLPQASKLKLRISYENPTSRMDFGGADKTLMLVEWV